MILLIFILAIIFASIFIYLGYSQNSFGFAYLGMFSFLLLGMFMLSEGIQIDNGIQEDPIGSGRFVTVYESYTPENNFLVLTLANVFFYIPAIGMLLTTFVALRGSS